jgi:excisionase family DNA binding protein
MGRKAYIKQAAVELGLTEYQLRRMAKEGKLPFLKSGVKFIFDIELCEEALKKQALENMRIEEPAKQYGVLRKVGVNH